MTSYIDERAFQGEKPSMFRPWTFCGIFEDIISEYCKLYLRTQKQNQTHCTRPPENRCRSIDTYVIWFWYKGHNREKTIAVRILRDKNTFFVRQLMITGIVLKYRNNWRQKQLKATTTEGNNNWRQRQLKATTTEGNNNWRQKPLVRSVRISIIYQINHPFTLQLLKQLRERK